MVSGPDLLISCSDSYQADGQGTLTCTSSQQLCQLFTTGKTMAGLAVLQKLYQKMLSRTRVNLPALKQLFCLAQALKKQKPNIANLIAAVIYLEIEWGLHNKRISPARHQLLLKQFGLVGKSRQFSLNVDKRYYASRKARSKIIKALGPRKRLSLYQVWQKVLKETKETKQDYR